MTLGIHMDKKRILAAFTGVALFTGILLVKTPAEENLQGVMQNTAGIENAAQPDNASLASKSPLSQANALPASYEKIKENQRFALYVEKSSGSFAVCSADNGTIWWSNPPEADKDAKAKNAKKNEMKSHVLLDVIDMERNKQSKLGDYSGSVKEGNAKFEKTEKGFRMIYSFEKNKMTVPVEYALEEDRLKAWVDVSKIKEEGKERIFSISILPYMASANGEEEGYMLVPDGSGGLIRLNNGKTSFRPYSQKLFDTNKALYSYMRASVSEMARAPLYGIKTRNAAMLAVVTEGAADGTVNADISGRFNNYNNIFCTFSLRYVDIFAYENERKSDVNVYQQGAPGLNKCQVDYFFQAGTDLDYVDMAAMYREYLIRDYGLQKEKEDVNPLYVTLYGAAVKKEPFLGIPVNKVLPLTTFDAAVKILEEASQAGIDRIILRYNAWSREGIWEKMPGKAAPENMLGGRDDFSTLQQAAKKHDAKLFTGVELLNHKRGSLLSRFFDWAKTIRGLPISVYDFKPNIFIRNESKGAGHLLKVEKISIVSENNAAAIKKLGSDGVALNDVSDTLYSDFSLQHPGMTQTYNSIVKAAERYKQTAGSVMVEGGTEQLIAGAEHVVNLPVGGSGFDVVDQEIPFLQMALHGIVSYTIPSINLSPNPDKMLLKALETGSKLHYTWIANPNADVKDSNLDMLYGAYYKDWMSVAADQYQTMKDIASTVGNRFITGHEQLGDGVYKTTYEGNVSVTVNYNNETVQANGKSIKGMGFLVEKEGE